MNNKFGACVAVYDLDKYLQNNIRKIVDKKDLSDYEKIALENLLRNFYLNYIVIEHKEKLRQYYKEDFQEDLRHCKRVISDKKIYKKFNDFEDIYELKKYLGESIYNSINTLLAGKVAVCHEDMDIVISGSKEEPIEFKMDNNKGIEIEGNNSYVSLPAILGFRDKKDVTLMVSGNLKAGEILMEGYYNDGFKYYIKFDIEEKPDLEDEMKELL